MQWVLGRGKSTIYMYGCLKIKQSSFYARIISIVAYQEKNQTRCFFDIKFEKKSLQNPINDIRFIYDPILYSSLKNNKHSEWFTQVFVWQEDVELAKTFAISLPQEHMHPVYWYLLDERNLFSVK